ncbi:MAG: hypothetical protein WBA87_10720 [Microbacterium sp.]
MKARALITAVGTLALVGSIVGSTHLDTVEGAWQSSSTASAQISAATLPRATFTTCKVNFNTLLGVNSLDLGWTSSQAGGQLVEFTRGSTVSTDTARVVQGTYSDGKYSYTANYPSANLLGLLGLSNILGSTSTIRVYSTAGSAWRSEPAARTLVINLLGLGYSCN